MILCVFIISIIVILLFIILGKCILPIRRKGTSIASAGGRKLSHTPVAEASEANSSGPTGKRDPYYYYYYYYYYVLLLLRTTTTTTYYYYY